MRHYYCLALIGALLFSLSRAISAQTITDGVLSGCMSLKGRYVVPEEVTKIDDYAFFTADVTEVEIGKNVQEIGNAAFQNCQKLERITFASGSQLQRIGDDAFSDCIKLVEIALPEGLIYLGVRSFWLDESLKQVTLPTTLDTLPKYCFQSCLSLRKISLPEGLKVIAENAFAGCENLATVGFPSSLDSIATKAFYKNLALMELSISEGVRSIADSAFMRCENLETVTLPASLAQVGAKLFRRCPELQSISVSSDSKHFIAQDGVLFSKDKKILYEAPAKLQCDNYIVPTETETIYHYAFYGCPDVGGITIPQTIARIGIGALVNNGMSQFTFGGNDTYWLEEGSLYYKAQTSEGDQKVYMAHPSQAEGQAVVSYGTTYVADYALAGCNKISSIRLPSTLLGMGLSVMDDCKSVRDIYSYRIEPPTIYAETLMGLDLPAVQLHVYPEAMMNYMNAPYWQLILHGDDLTGEEPLSVATPQSGDLLSWTCDREGALLIHNRGAETINVKIYSLAGALIRTLRLEGISVAQVALPTDGVYILSYKISQRETASELVIL